MKGFSAWLLWVLVHVYLLVGFENRLIVSIQWLWQWLTYQSGVRLISEDQPPASRRGQGPGE